MLRAKLPLPPSGNRIWKVVGRPFPKLHMSDEAKRYRERVKAHLLSEHVVEITALDLEAAYKLRLTFYLQALNKGWPKAAKTRFKDLDTSNRIILLENCIKEATGVNDNHNFWLDVRKKQVWPGQDEGVELVMEPLPDGWWDE